MKYHIITLKDRDLNEALFYLEKKVTGYLNIGWKPSGTIQIFKDNDFYICCQPMIKE